MSLPNHSPHGRPEPTPAALAPLALQVIHRNGISAEIPLAGVRPDAAYFAAIDGIIRSADGPLPGVEGGRARVLVSNRSSSRLATVTFFDHGAAVMSAVISWGETVGHRSAFASIEKLYLEKSDQYYRANPPPDDPRRGDFRILPRPPAEIRPGAVVAYVAAFLPAGTERFRPFVPSLYWLAYRLRASFGPATA